ncbi:hypothetical protein [Bosea sp. ANAM02]|uniref:hypothetical protein n=1 Tax=Bosea sp. ANAM02 TaxID=2020412 RepID=UPI0012DFF926|nr:MULTISPECIES: hypothetical protein [Hyphomicrobiales]BCB20589.1 hypothetical protein OCUBac02_34830 [Bosea sp. ANAM02]
MPVIGKDAMAEEDETTPQPAAGPKSKRKAISRKAVVGQLWRAAKRQIDTHEEHLADLPKGTTASEADAKALAVLARTVRELVAIEEPPATRKDKRSDDPSAADDLRHVAQLRQDLARRLEALVAQDARENPQEADADGDGG